MADRSGRTEPDGIYEGATSSTRPARAPSCSFVTTLTRRSFFSLAERAAASKSRYLYQRLYTRIKITLLYIVHTLYRQIDRINGTRED